MTDYSDFFNIYTYRDPLIYFKIETYGSWLHREMAVRKDFLLKNFINGLDVKMFQENPIFEPDILHSDTGVNSPDNTNGGNEGGEVKLSLTDTREDWFPPSPENEDILKDWNRENWKDLCIRLWDAARTHKWCIIQLYNTHPWWRVFTYREVHELFYDDNDVPTKAHCMWAKQLPVAANFNYHDETINLVEADAEILNKDGEINSLGLFVNWGHDIDERINGNDLEQVWSLSVQLRYILNDIINNSAKSSGFYHVTWGSGVSDAIKADIVNAFEMCGTSHMIGASEEAIKHIEAMFPKNPEFSIEAMDKVMKVFSGATGLPYLFYNGEKDTSGVFEENSSAMAQVNDKKREVFGQLKRYLLKLVEMRWGVVCEDVFLNIAEEESESFEEDVIDKKGSSSADSTGSELKKMRLQN